MAGMQAKAPSLRKIFLLYLLAMAFCPVGGKSSAAQATPPSVSVTISPGTQDVVAGATLQFSATLTGTANDAVNWAVNQVPGGNATVGKISLSGLYTAPAVVPSPSAVTVTATSLADSAKSASAIVTILPPPSVTVTISPGTQGVLVSATQQFTVSVGGAANTAVNWSVNQVPGGNASVGTISASGLYTAPAAVPSPSTVTVTATSVADSTKSASASVTVLPPPVVGVTISPATQDVVAGGTQQFAATVTGTANSAVNWAVNQISGGNDTVGRISTSGLYTAPAAVPSPSAVTVTATSVANSAKFASASVTVQPPPPAVTVTVSPATQNLVVGATQQFTSSVAGNANSAVNWSVNQVAGGSDTVGKISNAGLYTAPAAVPSPNTVTVTATSVVNTAKSASASVMVQPAPPSVAVKINPPIQGVVVGATQQFTATVTGNANTAVNWSVKQPPGGNANVGSISTSGLYTAPAAVPSPSTVTVTATSAADSTKSDSATVTVQTADARPTTMNISVSPTVITPSGGKLPSTALVSVAVVGCDDKSSIDLSTGGYTLVMEGVGFTLSPPSLSKCFLTSNLTIGPGAAPGKFSVILNDGAKSVGKTDIGVLDPTAGPIPPGLAPQVDVLWTVMGQRVCSDVFGKRVAMRFYCIEVKIGNNSGHALQLAGIGFRNPNVLGTPVRQANSSYAATRAVLQREEILSNRNRAYNLLDGAGLLMASFTPFFSNPNPKAHFSTASAIVSGALLQAFNIVAPDRVPGQLSNLDDQSLRDGSVIANNFQVRTTIFVEKRALTEALTQAVSEINARFQNNPEILTQQIANGSDEKKKNLLKLNLAEQKAMTHDQTNTIKNSRPSKMGTGSPSPFLVRKALGDLVIVGDPIEYLPRVQIQSNATPAAGVPAATTVTPSRVPADGNPAALTISGSLLQGATVAGPAGTFTVSNLKPSADGTGITLSLAVATAVQPGPYTLTITTSGGTTAIPIVVVPAAPSVTATAGTGSIALTWNAATGATSYNVYESTSAGKEALLTSVVTPSYTHSNLKTGTPYYYEVTAVSAFGESPKSAEVTTQPK